MAEKYFSDEVLAVIAGDAAPTHAVSIVLTLGRAYAAVFESGSAHDRDITKVLVMLSMSVDYGLPDGRKRVENASYQVLEYWLTRNREE